MTDNQVQQLLKSSVAFTLIILGFHELQALYPWNYPLKLFYGVLSSKLVLILKVIVQMWYLAEVHGDDVDVTFVVLFLLFFFSFKKYIENNNEEVLI